MAREWDYLKPDCKVRSHSSKFPEIFVDHRQISHLQNSGCVRIFFHTLIQVLIVNAGDSIYRRCKLALENQLPIRRRRTEDSQQKGRRRPVRQDRSRSSNAAEPENPRHGIFSCSAATGLSLRSAFNARYSAWPSSCPLVYLPLLRPRRHAPSSRARPSACSPLYSCLSALSVAFIDVPVTGRSPEYHFPAASGSPLWRSLCRFFSLTLLTPSLSTFEYEPYHKRTILYSFPLLAKAEQRELTPSSRRTCIHYPHQSWPGAPDPTTGAQPEPSASGTSIPTGKYPEELTTIATAEIPTLIGYKRTIRPASRVTTQRNLWKGRETCQTETATEGAKPRRPRKSPDPAFNRQTVRESTRSTVADSGPEVEKLRQSSNWPQISSVNDGTPHCLVSRPTTRRRGIRSQMPALFLNRQQTISRSGNLDRDQLSTSRQGVALGSMSPPGLPRMTRASDEWIRPSPHDRFPVERITDGADAT